MFLEFDDMTKEEDGSAVPAGICFGCENACFLRCHASCSADCKDSCSNTSKIA